MRQKPRESRTSRARSFFDVYTKDLTADDLQRLFTRETREAYLFFTRGTDPGAFAHLPWHKRAFEHARLLFLAFTMKLTPARRMVYAVALVVLAACFVLAARVYIRHQLRNLQQQLDNLTGT